MTNGNTAPADVVAELDEVIAEAEQAEASALPEPTTVDATGLAEQMASDNGVNLAEVEGTGKDGRVTVPDVDRFIKAQAAEAEQAKADVPADGETATPKKSKAKTKAKAKPKAKGFPSGIPPLPNIITGLVEVHHTTRAVGEISTGEWLASIVGKDDADENIGIMLADGWSLIKTQAMGYGPDGIEMLWVFGRFAESPEVREWPYREVYHLTRRLGDMGDDGRGVSGLAANALVNGYLAAGWDLALVEALDKSSGGSINMMWIFVR